MTVPTTVEFTNAAKVGASTGLLAKIDENGPLPAKIRLMAADENTILAQVNLDWPAGVVNGTTGQIVLTIDGPDLSANNTGTVAFAILSTNNDSVIMRIPAQEGTDPVSGYIVMNTLSVVAGQEVTINSAIIG